MSMIKYLNVAWKYLHEKCSDKNIRVNSGVGSSLFKASLALVLYMVAFGLMGADDWYGVDSFAWNQGVFVMLISFFIVSTICFDWGLLGPSTGRNFLLQLLLLAPFTLFLGRISGRPHSHNPDGIFGRARELIEGLGGMTGITSLIPKWMQEVFTSPSIALLLVGICVALAVKNKTAQKGLLLGTLLLPFLGAFAYQPAMTLQFVSGMVLMFSGMAVQYMDMNKYYWDLTLASALKPVTDGAERKASIRILQHAKKHAQITEQIFVSIARRCYQEEYHVDDVHMNEVAWALANRLVKEHGLLVMQISNAGTYWVVNEQIFFRENKLGEIIRWPRNVIISCIAILWLLSPIDLIPDAVPGIGAIDDVLISFLGFSPLVQQIGQMGRTRRTLHSGDGVWSAH